MKAQILKIAGVKSEKEFYKKFPTEAAFMKKHGKQLAKLKKAAVGDVIEYTDVEAGNNRKVIDGTELLESVNKDTLDYFDQFKDRAYELGLDSLTTEDEKEDYEYKAKIDAMYANMNKKDDGLLGKIQGLGGMLEGVSGMFGGGGPTGSVEVGDAEIIGMDVAGGKKGAKVEKFTPHMMYDPKTKKSKKAMTYKEHLALKKKGWGHEAPKAQDGKNVTEKVSDKDLNKIFDELIQRKTFNDLETRQLKNKIDSLKLKQKLKKKTPKAQTGLGQIQSMDLGFEIPEQSQYGNPDGSGMFGKAFSTGQYNEDGSAMNFGQKVGSFLQSDGLKEVLNSPITKDIMMGIGKIKSQKDDLKDLKQMQKVSSIARQAAMTKPEEIERDYVRPEDIQNTGEEFFPIYGVGTNVLAKHGGMYNAQRGGNFLNNFRAGGPRNLRLTNKELLGQGYYTYGMPYYKTMEERQKAIDEGQRKQRTSYGALPAGTFYDPRNSMTSLENGGYVPLTNTSKVKRFAEGGGVPWDSVFGTAGNFAYGDKASRDAGSNIGGGVGRGIGTLVGGPLGGAIGDFIGSGIGGLIDTNDNKQDIARDAINTNVSDMNNMKIGPQIHAGYASHMKQGGRLPGPNNDYGMLGAPGPQVLKSFDGKNLNNMLQKASRMPDTLKKGGSVAGDGNVKTLWGGDVNAVAYNPYAGGESLYFSGNSHENRDPKTGQTGIGVAYGPESVANNEAVVEVENEPAQMLEENGQENLVIYGDLKIPKEYSDEIGDPEAGGKKFKNYVNNLNDEEARINKQMGKAVVNAGESGNTKWGELERSTSEAILQGGDMKLKDIANKKTILADLQEALNDTFKERGMDGNTFISKGEIQAVKDTEDYAKNGGKMETYTDYAEDGAEIPMAQVGLKTRNLPTQFETEEEAIEAGFEFDEVSKKWRRVKVEEVEGVDATGSDIGDMPKGQKYDDKTGLAGNVTEADYETFVKENPWFDWENFDRRKKEDVKRFQREFNKRNKDAGIDVSLSVDGVVGEETSSARFSPEVEPGEVQYEYAQVDEPETTTPTTTVKPRLPFDANLLRGLFPRRIDNDLDYNQILPELNAAANNQLDPVYAQSFQPRLRVPYDISLQDRRNQLTSQYRAMSQNPAVQNNPALAAAMAAPMYDAINNTTAEEFRLNQAMKDQVYSGNIATLNQANLTNMGLYDQQQQRQAQAVANTKETQQEIVKSISDKYQQNKLENRREKVLRELYPNFRFTENLDLFNQGVTQFNTGKNNTSALGPYKSIFDYLTGGGFGGGQGNNTTTPTTTVAPESAHGMKLTPINRKVKRNQRNSNVLRQFKKQ